MQTVPERCVEESEIGTENGHINMLSSGAFMSA
jgi:hypothetical protein